MFSCLCGNGREETQTECLKTCKVVTGCSSIYCLILRDAKFVQTSDHEKQSSNIRDLNSWFKQHPFPPRWTACIFLYWTSGIFTLLIIPLYKKNSLFPKTSVAAMLDEEFIHFFLYISIHFLIYPFLICSCGLCSPGCPDFSSCL